jgi:ABC-type bacteriocin/lantibiotic exporter with double-glycine peptidase domain
MSNRQDQAQNTTGEAPVAAAPLRLRQFGLGGKLRGEQQRTVPEGGERKSTLSEGAVEQKSALPEEEGKGGKALSEEVRAIESVSQDVAAITWKPYVLRVDNKPEDDLEIFRDESIAAWGRKILPRRKVPVLTQMSATECGAACLAMVLSYYGYQTGVAEVSNDCGVGRDGLSALSIVKAARRYQMQVRAITADIDNFEYVTLPAIVHWQFNHFIVVEKWNPQYVLVVDPALGRRKLTIEEFDAGFTGICVMLQPGPGFTQRQGSPRSSLLREYVIKIVKTAPTSFIQVLIASLISLIFGLLMPVTTSIVVDKIIPQSLQNGLYVFGLGMLIFMLAQLLLGVVRSVIVVKLTVMVDTSMVLGFFDHLISLPLKFFQLRSSGDILSRMESNSVIRDTINAQLIGVVLDSLSIVVYLVILSIFSPLFAILSLIFGLLEILVVLGTTRPLLSFLQRSLEAQSKSLGYLTEVLYGITALKAAGIEQLARERWAGLFFAEMHAEVKRDYFSTLVVVAETFLSSLAPLTLLLVGAREVMDGNLTLGSMLALQSLSSSFLAPISSLIGAARQIQLVYVHLDRLADVMRAEPEQEAEKPLHPPRLTGHIRLEDVSFQYDLNSAAIFHSVNLTIEPGQKVAIVGRSGAGKSTLGKLLLGLYLPTKGQIFYDNVSLHDMNYREVRAQFGVVMQDVGMFSGSIRENISMNIPGISLDNVVQAAKLAAFHDDIVKMPMDYETQVSEGGGALSGGQRQRMALARALVRCPSVILLDEATSSLDVVTERRVETNLQRLPCTQIIIAHRLSTIRNADMILVVDQGTITERGSHEELLQRHGFYAHLIQSQLASGEIR